MRTQKGFTIVELLIVIVVIAILASITIVAYNGIQQRSSNTVTQQGLASYAKAMGMYAVTNGVFPGAGSGGCLKDTSDSNTCGAVGGSNPCFGMSPATRNSTFDTAITSVGSTLPVISSQAPTCGGQPYRGAMLSVAPGGKSSSIYAYYSGSITCPNVANLNMILQQQSGNVTQCLYVFETLP